MRPRARLIALIGEELISDEPVALVELVKNAYDADATRVDIRFDGGSPDEPARAIVADDGHGMDLNTVLSAWFEPGTTAKTNTRTSPKGRLYQGAKGIGRFAAARLAESMLLETKRSDSVDGVVVLISWGAFDEASYLDEVQVIWELRPLEDFAHGTRLTLELLRKRWSEADYQELHSRLSRLASPFDDVADFKIMLSVPARLDLSGEIQPPELLLKPKYRLGGSLDAVGHFSGEVFVNERSTRVITREKLGAKGAIPVCGPFDVEIRAWDRDREGLGPLAESLNESVHTIRQTLDAYCGVSIYRNGFRVYPYGQKGNDWLNLDIRSRLNPVKHLANNQVVAAIRISRDNNPELKDRSTREGMVLNSSHTALEEWFKQVLAVLEGERYDVRPRQEKAVDGQPLFEVFDLSEVVKSARSTLGSLHPISTLVERAGKQVEAGVERVQAVFSRLLMLSGLGHMIDIVIHEIGAPLGKINRQLSLLERELTQRLDADGRERVLPMIASIKAWLEQIHSLRARLEPQTPAKRGRITVFDVREEVDNTLSLYSALIEKQRVVYKTLGPGQAIEPRMSRAVLAQLLANLIDNSVYWLVREKGPGGGGHIHVRWQRLDHGFTLRVSDDGPGVREEDRARIFEPYFSRKPDGIGLGLYISRLLVEPYGHLEYREEGDLPGACFEAVFERNVGF